MRISNLDQILVNYPFQSRSYLTLPEDVNFGLEIELDKVNCQSVSKKVANGFGNKWKVKKDDSLTLNHNAEIISPLLQNKKHTWIVLNRMSQMIEKLNPSYEKCSFQVNFDGELLPNLDDRVRFLKLFAVYEDIIYRFSKGEDDNYRDSLDMYAAPIMLALKGVISFDKESILELFSNNKRYGLVFKNKNKDLIEFRTPNGTNNLALWQNYITLFYYLLRYSVSNNCDEEKLDYYIEKFYKIYLLENYENYYEERALDFSNTIFSNDEDKIYFMHHYIGKKGRK